MSLASQRTQLPLYREAEGLERYNETKDSILGPVERVYASLPFKGPACEF